MIKKIMKSLGIALSAIALVVAIFVAYKFTYIKRIATSMGTEQVREVDWYEPKIAMQAAKKPEKIIFTQPQNTSTDRQFADAIEYAQDINSSAFLVWQGGELIVDKYWAPYDKNSYTQTHSIHKSLLSMLVGIAIDEGAITSIDDPVSKYLGHWIEQPLGQISVKNLLNMTSGLGEEPASFFLFSHFLRLLNETDISAVAQSLPQSVAPGQEFEYINNNPQLLVDVLESATGQSYETYLQDKIWSKVAESKGYLWMDREDGTPHGYCCLIAKPEDLLRLGMLVLNHGQVNGQQVVPKQWLEEATAPSKMNPNYGYLMWLGSPYVEHRKYSAKSAFSVLHSEPYLAEDIIYFDGFGGQRVYIIPSRDLIIVRVGEMRMDFDDALLPNRVIAALEAKGAAEQKTEYKVGVIETDISAPHNEALNLHISYPLNVHGDLPLIVFSHGNFLTADAYQKLTDPWVSQGFVVVAPTHLDAGGVEAGTSARQKYGSDWLTASRVLDMRASADSIANILAEVQDFKGSVITDKYIAAGHSYGALTAQILAGAKLELQGDANKTIPTTLVDERVAGVIAVSPPGTLPNVLSNKTWSDFTAPQLVITGTKDVLPPVWNDYKMHEVSFHSAVEGNNYLLVLKDVDHYFGHLIGRLNETNNAQEQALKTVSDTALSFAKGYLSQDVNKRNQFAQMPLANLAEVLQFTHR
jgi:CubicO group peptidase (beta-lactamase class C family)/dienelactone hydrolase